MHATPLVAGAMPNCTGEACEYWGNCWEDAASNALRRQMLQHQLARKRSPPPPAGSMMNDMAGMLGLLAPAPFAHFLTAAVAPLSQSVGTLMQKPIDLKGSGWCVPRGDASGLSTLMPLLSAVGTGPLGDVALWR